MNCEQIRENLAAFIDGELDESQVSDIQSHLEGCAQCREELEALRRTARALGEFLEPRAMNESVAEGVLASLASEHKKRRVPLLARVTWALTGAVAAVFILVVFGFLGVGGGGIDVFADEMVDEALADHTLTMELFRKQVVNSAMGDPKRGVRLIQVELQLSGLKEKTARLEKLLTCSRHPRSEEIRKYVTSVHELLCFVQDPPIHDPSAVFPALKRNAQNIVPIRNIAIVKAMGNARIDIEIPEDLDEQIRKFASARKELYGGNFEKAAHEFNLVIKESPESPIAEDAKYWVGYIKLRSDGQTIEIKSNVQIPRHPPLRKEMYKDVMDCWKRRGAKDAHPDPKRMKNMQKMLKNMSEKMGIKVETTQDEHGNTVIKVVGKDARGNKSTVIEIIQKAGARAPRNKESEDEPKDK